MYFYLQTALPWLCVCERASLLPHHNCFSGVGQVHVRVSTFDGIVATPCFLMECAPCARSWVDVAVPCDSSSDAAAVGGGLAALMLAANPALTPEQIRAAFRGGVDVLSSMQGKVATNVSRCVRYMWCEQADMRRGLLHPHKGFWVLSCWRPARNEHWQPARPSAICRQVHSDT